MRKIESFIRDVEKDLLRMAEVRTSKAKDGLEKQAAIKSELELIREISDRNHDALKAIEDNTREKARQELTGEGRKNARNQAKDAAVENAKVNNRIRA